MSEGYSLTPQFDWYGATLDYDPHVLAEWLAEVFAGEVKPGRGQHGYRAGLDVKREGRAVARIWYGGQNGTIHVESSGEDARVLAAAMQDTMHGYYRVSRVDSAYDFVEGDEWARLFEACMTVADYLPTGEARRRKLSVRTVGDWLREDEGHPDGRTLYIGAPSSPVMVRLYEKGKQLRKAFPDQAEKFPVGWVRMEVQWRPQKAARRDAAALSPRDIWGAGAWVRDLHARALNGAVERLQPQTKALPDDDRAWYYLVKQYGPLLRRRAERDGWDGVRDALRRDLG